MKIRNYELYEINAGLCLTLAHPKRLMMVDMLGRREMNVGEIAEVLAMRPAAVSQQLRILRDRQLVATRKEGQTIYYRLAIPELSKACRIIHTVLLGEMRRRGLIASDVNPDNLIEDGPATKQVVPKWKALRTPAS
jgi:ArsR family transcriptional regulator